MGVFVLYAFLLIGLVFRTTESYQAAELRDYYQKASKCGQTAEAFHKFMSAYTGKDPVILGFKGASEAVMAKYAWSPYNKLKHLKTSAAIFEQAVKLDPDNAEIRFLRYTVEYYVPRYLNLSGHVEEDRKIILNSLYNYPKSGLNPEPVKIMRDFLLTANHLNEQEKQQLRTIKI
jgi:tetratricopeptide (TPR) repeat protein